MTYIAASCYDFQKSFELDNPYADPRVPISASCKKPTALPAFAR